MSLYTWLGERDPQNKNYDTYKARVWASQRRVTQSGKYSSVRTGFSWESDK